MKKIIAAFILALAAPCVAQTDVSAFFSGTSEGITYFLPDTKINITVEASCVTRTPGEFSNYAERFLHIKDAITEPGYSWEIIGIESCCEGIPCKEKAYTVKLNGSTASNISLDNKGIIEAINTVAPTRSTTEKASTKESNGSHLDASPYMTEEMLTATSTAKMAELTAKEIYAIRESKLAITRGQSENMPSDGVAITLLLQELDKQERALTEMFTGRTDTLHYTYKYELVPDRECDTTKAVLFRFSRKLGVLDKENLAGESIYYDIKNLKTVELPVADEAAADRKTIKKEGICYNIPGRARMEIYTRAKTFLKKEIAIAQIGSTEVLSKTLFGKNNTTKVLFDTATGGIISIKRE
ncbi:MAG: DUF4831 family protein [Bacteroidaceae bacterium]|nr:DUF4831 family protein [Bacteroidaceae bacterium]